MSRQILEMDLHRCFCAPDEERTAGFLTSLSELNSFLAWGNDLL